MNKNIKQNKRKKVCVFACVAVLAAMPFVLGNTPVQQSIFDLEGTSWTFNDNITFPDNLSSEGKFVYDVLLTTGGHSYTAFVLWYDYFGAGGFQLSYEDEYGGTDVFYDSIDNPSWSSDSYKDVSFVGGSDLTDVALIDFMQQNATIVEGAPVENLDLYDQIFEILSDYIFGGQVTQDDMSYKALILTAGSTILTVFMVSLPFLAVFAFIKLFF